jgi:integrase
VPLIGDVKLAHLVPSSVIDFRNALIKQKRSRALASKVLVSLGAVLGTAMAAGLVARNVVRDQASGHAKRQRRLEKRHDKRLEVGVDIPTKDEIRALLTTAQGRWRPLIVTVVFTGLRASELRGLRWSDVELGGGGKSVCPPARRPLQCHRLAQEQRRQAHRAVGADGRQHAEGMASRLPEGRARPGVPECPGRGREPARDVGRARGRTEGRRPRRSRRAPRYGMHAFRHAAASLLIDHGLSPKRVQAIMGHSTISVTFDVCDHLFPDADENQAVMQQLQARLIG